VPDATSSVDRGQQQIFGDRRALDTNDNAELPIVATSGLPSSLRMNMPISA
jgi:hypothetical protein